MNAIEHFDEWLVGTQVEPRMWAIEHHFGINNFQLARLCNIAQAGLKTLSYAILLMQVGDELLWKGLVLIVSIQSGMVFFGFGLIWIKEAECVVSKSGTNPERLKHKERIATGVVFSIVACSAYGVLSAFMGFQLVGWVYFLLFVCTLLLISFLIACNGKPEEWMPAEKEKVHNAVPQLG